MESARGPLLAAPRPAASEQTREPPTLTPSGAAPGPRLGGSDRGASPEGSAAGPPDSPVTTTALPPVGIRFRRALLAETSQQAAPVRAALSGSGRTAWPSACRTASSPTRSSSSRLSNRSARRRRSARLPRKSSHTERLHAQPSSMRGRAGGGTGGPGLRERQAAARAAANKRQAAAAPGCPERASADRVRREAPLEL